MCCCFMYLAPCGECLGVRFLVVSSKLAGVQLQQQQQQQQQHSYGKSQVGIGKSTINGPCSIAMLVYQRVYIISCV